MRAGPSTVQQGSRRSPAHRPGIRGRVWPAGPDDLQPGYGVDGRGEEAAADQVRRDQAQRVAQPACAVYGDRPASGGVQQGEEAVQSLQSNTHLPAPTDAAAAAATVVAGDGGGDDSDEIFDADAVVKEGGGVVQRIIALDYKGDTKVGK